MAIYDGTNTTAGGVIRGSIGTALTSSDIALGAGWGDGAVTLAITSGSNIQRGKIAITSVGSNQAQATATVIITYPEAASSAPFCVPDVTSTSAIDEGHVTWTSTTSALTLTYSVLPVATKVYTISWICAF